MEKLPINECTFKNSSIISGLLSDCTVSEGTSCGYEACAVSKTSRVSKQQEKNLQEHKRSNDPKSCFLRFQDLSPELKPNKPF